MPIFQYKCKQCGDEFELIVIKTGIVPICKCGSNDVERLLTAPGGFKFKGPGFYHTDHKVPERNEKLTRELRGEK